MFLRAKTTPCRFSSTTVPVALLPMSQSTSAAAGQSPAKALAGFQCVPVRAGVCRFEFTQVLRDIAVIIFRPGFGRFRANYRTSAPIPVRAPGHVPVHVPVRVAARKGAQKRARARRSAQMRANARKSLQLLTIARRLLQAPFCPKCWRENTYAF